MKKLILTACLAMVFSAGRAQSEDYFVKTKNVKKVDATASTGDESTAKEPEKARDFISSNFPYYSLCDWKEDMKFIVLPEKYDMVVKTFHEYETGHEVSSMSLRRKIMLYKGHTVGADGHGHINFLCRDDNRMYYFEIPNGKFEDYCYNKLGVPTLAYLGDVDVAKQLLIGKVLFTMATEYRVDTDAESDKFETVKVKLKQEVKVVDVGVGTRSFPVKIIVEDKDGNEFYQNVAISRTNSGLREDEFINGDNARYTFAGSFEMQDAIMAVSGDIKSYIGQTVHTKVRTPMKSKGDGKERTLTVPTQTTFKIEAIQPHSDSEYVTLTLEQSDTRRIYTKDVLFKNVSVVVEEAGGKLDDYFGYIFAMGDGKDVETSPAARAAIREGRVIIGMSEDEVTMTMADPDATVNENNGYYQWIYITTQGKRLIVRFSPTGRVISVNTVAGATRNGQSGGSRKRSTGTKASARSERTMGTPLTK